MIVTTHDIDHQVLLKPAAKVELPFNSYAKQCMTELKDIFDSLSSPYSKPAGLAAPQIGHSLQMFIFHVPENADQFRKYVVDKNIAPTLIINPEITFLAEEGKTIDWEACYSIPDHMGEVERFHAIQLNGLIANSETHEYQNLTTPLILRGFAARVVQHECQHLRGELYNDSIKGRYGPIEEFKPIRDREFAEWLQC